MFSDEHMVHKPQNCFPTLTRLPFLSAKILLQPLDHSPQYPLEQNKSPIIQDEDDDDDVKIHLSGLSINNSIEAPISISLGSIDNSIANHGLSISHER